MNIDWNNIVRENGAAVYGVAWRILGHAADSEDIVQEVFLESQQLGKPEKVRNWPGFLKQLATFRSLDRLRRRKPTCPVDESHASDSQSPEAATIARELQTELREAIAQLPRQQSAVFCLRFFEDETNQQIAATLNMSESSVSTAINKAKSKLRTILEPSQDQ